MDLIKLRGILELLMTFYVKNLSGIGISWPLFVLPSCWAMNSQVSHVTGFSPYEMGLSSNPHLIYLILILI